MAFIYYTQFALFFTRITEELYETEVGPIKDYSKTIEP